jgi:Heparan-alpha-glucosaminide N-acetyltransferase, catalytic
LHATFVVRVDVDPALLDRAFSIRMAARGRTMADARAERADVNVLRGLAGLYMVIHHVWARYPLPVSGLGRALVELGSCAPVLFFFVTGVGYGVQGSRRGALAASTVKKVALLLLADHLLNLRSNRLIGLDFLGFIAISMLVLEWIARRKRPAVVALALAFAVVAARYGLGAKGALLRLGLDGDGAAWFEIAVGAKGVLGVSYPPCPWLAYPLLGFALARTGPALGRWRFLLGVAAVTLGSGASALLFARAGLAFFRWGTVSVAFFAVSFAALGGSIAAALVITRLPRAAAALSLRGVAALVVVPVHYFCVELAATLQRPPEDGAQLFLLGVPIVVVAFASSKGAALVIQRMAAWPRARALYLTACITAAGCAWLLIPGRGAPLPPFWATACMAAGQLALCALLVWRWEPATSQAPSIARP